MFAKQERTRAFVMLGVEFEDGGGQALKLDLPEEVVWPLLVEPSPDDWLVLATVLGLKMSDPEILNPEPRTTQ